MSYICSHGCHGSDLAPWEPFSPAKLQSKILNVEGGHQEDVTARWHASWTQVINQRFLPLVLGMCALPTVPIAGAPPKTWPWESMVLRLSVLNMWLISVKASTWTFRILVARFRSLLALCHLKSSLICKFPCLLKLPPSDLEWSISFFDLSFPSTYRVVKHHLLEAEAY